MSAFELLWIFLALAALQPVLRQRLLESWRRRLIAKLERERRGRMILLVHRQESMSFLGFPLLRFIDLQDSEAIIHALQVTAPDVPIDLVLHTPGGLALSASQIARAIKQHPAKVTVFVPHYAMSGGTLIALAADEIVMCPHSVLGPVDPQVGKFPAASLLKVVNDKPIAEIDDETLILADQAHKAVRQFEALVAEVMAGTYAEETVSRLSKLLTQGTWTHDYPITCEEALGLGLRVSTDMPADVLELMTYYPQPMRRTPSVEVGESPVGPSRKPSSPSRRGSSGGQTS